MNPVPDLAASQVRAVLSPYVDMVSFLLDNTPEANYQYRRYTQSSTGRYYYVNLKTGAFAPLSTANLHQGKAQWEKPSGWASPQQLASLLYQRFTAGRRKEVVATSPEGIPYQKPLAPLDPPPVLNTYFTLLPF